MSEPDAKPVDRRRFLRSGAAVVAVGRQLRQGHRGQRPPRRRVRRLRRPGPGPHQRGLEASKQDGQAIAPAAVCDVWDGQEDSTTHEFPPGQFTRRNYAQGLYPSAKKCGLDRADSARVTKDYRRLLDLQGRGRRSASPRPTTGTRKQTLDALAAGKDVYVEKPMTRTADEASAVVDAANKPTGWSPSACRGWPTRCGCTANDLIRTGTIGHVVQAQTGVLPQRRPRPVAVLPAHPADVAEDDRLGPVPRPQFEVNGEPARAAGSAVRPGRVRPVAVLLARSPAASFTDLLVHQATQHPGRDGRALPATGGRAAAGCTRNTTAGTCRTWHRGRRLRRGLPARVHRDDGERLPGRGGDPRPVRGDQVRQGRVAADARRPDAGVGLAAAARKAGRADRDGGRQPAGERDARAVGALPRLRPRPEPLDALPAGAGGRGRDAGGDGRRAVTAPGRC